MAVIGPDAKRPSPIRARKSDPSNFMGLNLRPSRRQWEGMLLQTNSYVVPARQRAEHARLLDRFRRALARVGCDLFEVYEQADANWAAPEGDARFVQIIRFRDRQHQLDVREAERLDLEAQSLIEEFCQLINFPYQQEHGLFAVGFYNELSPADPPTVVEQTMDVDQDLDDMIAELGDPRPLLAQETDEVAPDVASGRRAGKGDSDLASVLDAGLASDDLDIPMEAELLDDPDEVPIAPKPATNPIPARSRHARK